MYDLLAIEPPILTPYYDIIKWTLIVEFAVVILVGVISIFLQRFLKRKSSQSLKNREELKALLTGQIEKQEPFRLAQVPSRLLDISTLLTVVGEFDKEPPSQYWDTYKKQIAEEFLLPKARKYTKSFRWTSKLKAARCFVLAPKQEDEADLIQLLRHKVPVIKYIAAHSTAKIGTERAFEAILKEMDGSSHFLRQPFHDALMEGGETTFAFLEKKLESEKNAYTRVSCIEVLTNRMNDHVVSLIEQDLTSEHKNLKIAAIRALGHYKSERSIQLLLPLLQASEWEVRALAARSLGYLGAKQALEALLAACKDKEWWVRMNAAFALKRLGEEGTQSLRNIDQKEDSYAYDIAQYALSMNEV